LARQGITYKDNVTPRLRLLPTNTYAALETGATEAVSISVKAIRKQVIGAKTKTGIRRAAGLPPLFKPRAAWFLGNGPGRVESGRMLASARWQATVTAHGISMTAGFINPPRYTALQEEGSPGQHGVPAMLAYAKGHTTMQARFVPTMNKYVERGVRYAQQGQVLQTQVTQ
jgi:hypothetical protein